MLSRILARAGIEVEAVHDRSKKRWNASKSCPDVVILDVKLPDHFRIRSVPPHQEPILSTAF